MIEWAMSIPPFTPCPATGDAFIGRQGLVGNLRRRIARGESLAVIGGPKLGKTSLVRTALEGLSDRTVIEVDCGTDPSPRVKEVRIDRGSGTIWTKSLARRSHRYSCACRRRGQPVSP